MNIGVPPNWRQMFLDIAFLLRSAPRAMPMVLSGPGYSCLQKAGQQFIHIRFLPRSVDVWPQH